MVLNPAVADALLAVDEGATASTLESATLDFKTIGRSSGDTEVDLAEAAVCFANAAGGHLVVGVADRARGREAFVGCTLEVDRLQRRIYDVTTPSLIVTVEQHVWAGRRLVVVSVPRSPDVHQVRGRATERVGASCEPMSAVRIAAVVAERRGDDWSSGDSGVPVGEVASQAVEEVRRLLSQAPDPERRSWAGLSQADLVRRLGLGTPEGTLTRAGVMLLVHDERPSVAYTHRRTRSGELTTNVELRGARLTVLLRSLEMIDARVDRTPVNLPSGQQLLIADLPELAVREAVVNAFIHRDHQAGGVVQVEHSSTRLAVTSPGSFVLGVSPQNILTVSSRSRNASLTRTVRALTLAESAGVGVDRMYAEMVRVGHQPPVWSSDPFRVTVTLNGGAPNSSVTRFAATLPGGRDSDPDTLLVMLALLSHRTTTATALSPVVQKPVDEVEVLLRELATPAVALVERTRESANARSGVYRLRDAALAALGPAVAYRRRVGDDTDRKVIEIVRETGSVNGRIVRTLLDVDAPTASRVLADLVTRGLLVKTSEAQRGPSVAYGPGPEFPKGSRRRARRGP